MNDNYLFSVMLKYHPAIVGRLANQERVCLEEDKIVVKPEICESHSDAINYHQYRELETDSNNVTKVVASSFDMQQKDIYLEIRTSCPEIFKDLGVPVYNSNFESTYKYFCPPSALSELLTKHSESIDSIRLPKGYVVSGELVHYYVEILQRQIVTIKEYREKGYHISNLEGRYQMYSYKDYGVWPHQSWYEFVEKCDFLSYTRIYYEIEWDFDMVEEYKDRILWINLMEDSNLRWTEADMLSFDSYIPHKELRSSKVYCNNFIPATGYGCVEQLSNKYIESHKDVLNWEVFVETAAFHWNEEDLFHYYTYVNCKKDTNDKGDWENYRSLDSFRDSQDPKSWNIDNHVFAMYELSRNPRFEWTPELLKTMIILYPAALDYCIEDRRFSDLLFRIPNYKELVNEKNDDPDFWRKLHDGGKKNHNAYSEYFFTIENIQTHKKEWNEQLEDKFLTVQRTPDTNYHYHAVFTMWDYFCGNEAVRLTYELSKYLQTINVTFGGMYILEDGLNVGEDHRFQKYNGLDAFSGHQISNVEEIEKICNDAELLDMFINRKMGQPNICIVDYLIDRFFNNFALEDYLSIVNQMKNWGSICKYD